MFNIIMIINFNNKYKYAYFSWIITILIRNSYPFSRECGVPLVTWSVCCSVTPIWNIYLSAHMLFSWCQYWWLFTCGMVTWCKGCQTTSILGWAISDNHLTDYQSLFISCVVQWRPSMVPIVFSLPKPVDDRNFLSMRDFIAPIYKWFAMYCQLAIIHEIGKYVLYVGRVP